jgi:hypothetical protein
VIVNGEKRNPKKVKPTNEKTISIPLPEELKYRSNIEEPLFYFEDRS